MAKRLVIAEKPSVAADIARALGGFTRHGDYFESDDTIVSSAVGHLLEIGMPEEEEVKRGKWTFAHLPAIPSRVRAEADREVRGPAEDAAQADQAQGRRLARQRVRRRPRGRAHLPLHRPVRGHRQADPAAVAAVDDDGGDPRRLRRAAHRRGDAAARRRREVPLRVRLARRHQRHARDDGVQLEGGRLPADDRRARADADARDPGRARGEDPRVRAARLLGGARHVPRGGRRVPGPLVRREVPQAGGRSGRARRAPVGRGEGAGDRGEVRGQARRRHRGVEAVDAEPAAALRPDDAAARGQRPLRLLGAHDAVARAGALREAQGADLSAHRLARAARGLHRHRARRRSRCSARPTPTARTRGA